MVKVIWHKAAS